MTRFVEVALPQESANDLSAHIITWTKAAGEPVRQGEVICSAETTKAVFDVEAPAAGYLTPLVHAGSDVAVGETIAVVTDVPVPIEDVRTWVSERAPVTPIPESTWTYKAKLLARQHGIDPAEVQTERGRITEADIRAYLEARSVRRADLAEVRDLMDDPYQAGRIQRLLVVGAGDGAALVLDTVACIPGQRVVALVDDNVALHGREMSGVPIVGPVNAESASADFRAGKFDAAVIAVSTNIDFRARVFDEWQARGIPFTNVIHPSALIGSNVSLGDGNFVMPFCRIATCARVGHNNFLSAYCSIEHHGVLGDHCTFGPGVLTSGRVQIGDRVRFGTGIFIEPHATIGSDAIIGSGVTLRQGLRVPERSVLKTKDSYVERPRSS